MEISYPVTEIGHQACIADSNRAGAVEELKDAQISNQFETLAKLDGDVEVRACDTMPFGFFVQGESAVDGQWMLIGLMPATEAFIEGPMITVRPESKKLWRILTFRN